MLSTILHTIATALAAHPAIAAWALASLAALYRSHTPAQWVAMGERIPRVQGLLRLARGAGLDPVRALEGAAQVVTGRVPVDPRDAEIASLREALAAYQRRTLDSHAVTMTFDPSARQTIAPEVAEVARRITDGQRGHVETGVLGYLLVLAVVAVAAVGCPNWQRPACATPGTSLCVRNQPHYCGTAHELTPVGDEPCERTGRVCVIDPDGTGSCAPAADGGVR